MRKFFHWLICDYGTWFDQQCEIVSTVTGKTLTKLGQVKICKICKKKVIRWLK